MKEKKSSRLLLFLMYIVPKNLLSRLGGALGRVRWPRFMLRPFLRWFIKYYNVNVEEAELPLEDYSDLNQFFTRALRPGLRPVDPAPAVLVSPVDGSVSSFGDVRDGRMIQAKGIDYAMEALLDCPEFAPRFKGGNHVTFYLSPPDYHRIHSPCSGRVLGYAHRPGKLFSVNDITVYDVRGLYTLNERLTTLLETAYGLVAVVKVGAFNVGRIRVTYDEITTNRWFRRPGLVLYDEPKPMGKGDELGRFDLGSTVVLLFERGAVRLSPSLVEGQRIKFGEAIGRFT